MRKYKWNQENPPLLLWDWQYLRNWTRELFRHCSWEWYSHSGEKMLLNQEKFTTGSEIPHLRTSPQDKLVYKCTKRMLRDTACNKRDWGRPPRAAATERSQMVEYSKSNRKTLRTQINLPDMLLNENSKFQNKTAVFRHHLFKTRTGNHSVQFLSRPPHTHTWRQSGGKRFMVTGGLSQEGEEGVTFTSHLEKVCDPMDYNPSGSSLHGILQARILEWVAISSSGGSSWPRDQAHVSFIADIFFTAEPSGKALKHASRLKIETTVGLSLVFPFFKGKLSHSCYCIISENCHLI